MIGFYFICNKVEGQVLRSLLYVYALGVCIKVTDTMYSTGLMLMA